MMFWYAVMHVMGRLGLFKPYCRLIDKLLDLLGDDLLGEEAEV